MSPIYPVRLRGGFSDRNGIKPENVQIQLYDFDERTRVTLLNSTISIFYGIIQYRMNLYGQGETIIVNKMMSEVYGQSLFMNGNFSSAALLKCVESTILTDDYDSILTVIEYINNISPQCYIRSDYFEGNNPSEIYNNIFEKEYVGYRFVNGKIVAITDNREIEEIEDANRIEYDEVRQHFEKALGFLSDRENADYENSIKESISAVERMCSIIIGKSTTLGDALKKLEEAKVSIHPALKSAFDKLYGYTSDSSGIRHSGKLGGPESTFEEAKFMLVSCCAFVNYLKGVWSKMS